MKEPNLNCTQDKCYNTWSSKLYQTLQLLYESVGSLRPLSTASVPKSRTKTKGLQGQNPGTFPAEIRPAKKKINVFPTNTQIEEEKIEKNTREQINLCYPWG